MPTTPRRASRVCAGTTVNDAVGADGLHVPQVAVAHEPAGAGQVPVVQAGDDPVADPDRHAGARREAARLDQSVLDAVVVRPGVQRGHGGGVGGEQDGGVAGGDVGGPGAVGVLEHRLPRPGVHPLGVLVDLKDAGVAGAQGGGGVGLPRVGEPPQGAQLGAAGAVDEQAERSPGVDRGQLGVVADEQQLGAGLCGLAGQLVERECPCQRRLVDDHELTGTEGPASALGTKPLHRGVDGAQLADVPWPGGRSHRQQAFDDRGALGGAGAGGLVQPLGGVLAGDSEGSGEVGGGGRRGRQADHRTAAVLAFPHPAQRGQGGRLARPGRADEQIDQPPRAGDRAHGVRPGRRPA